MSSGNSEIKDRQNPSNWYVTSNNGTTVVARNRITGEAFSGTSAALKAIWSVSALPVEDAHWEPASDGSTKLIDDTKFGLYRGTGVPTFNAAKGSLYCRMDGSSVSTRLYIATTAVGGWTPVTTAT